MFEHHLSVRDDLVASFQTGIGEEAVDSGVMET
jgi:hypothetical protein